jgi:hypothetical protein
MIFFSTLASDFFMLNALNPPLFIRDWSLIRTGIIRTVDLKLSLWTVRFWQLKATWVGLFGEASRPLWCQSAKKNYIGVWSSIRPSCWCIVCLVWLGDEALNALKMWPSEQLSSGKGRRWWIVTRRQVVSFVPFSFYCSVKTCCFI